jgi:2-dehydro-3-deoxyglucarate aldolase
MVRKALDAGVPLAGLGFETDDVNKKADSGYQMLNLGTTTGALRSAVSEWLDGYAGER